MSRFARVLAFSLVLVLLAACADDASTTPHGIVESYLQALVAKDDDRYFATICPAWEADARLERDAYWAVTAELAEVACSTAGTDGDLTLVNCTGQIILNYDGETRERPLDGVTFLAQKHDGDWKMCGYR